MSKYEMPIYEDLKIRQNPPITTFPPPLELRSRLLTHPLMSQGSKNPPIRRHGLYGTESDSIYVEKDKGTEASPSVEEWKSQIKDRLMYLNTLSALSHLHLVLMLILLIVGWIISMLLLMILLDQTYSSSFNVSW